MKKLPFYIAIGIAVAAVAALVYSYFNNGKLPLFFGSNDVPDTPKPVLKGYTDTIKLNQLLSDDSKNTTNEIIVLQNILNAITPGSVTVSGTYDTNTMKAVKDITGKESTSLYEILYINLAPKIGQNEANDLLHNS
jgi:hypothetical protein